MRTVAISLLVLLFAGCTQAELDRIDPPLQESKCDANNRFLCPDGHGCCNMVYPVCWGPDSEGWYCQSPDYNPDDPGGVLFGGQQHRERAVKRVDE